MKVMPLSTAAFQPGPLMAVYYATKAFVLSFSEAIGDIAAMTDPIRSLDDLTPGMAWDLGTLTLSLEDGGAIDRHASHESGRDADVGFRLCCG